MTSLGAKSVPVRTLDDMAAAAEAVKARRPGQPVFIEVSLDPEMISAITTHR